MKKMNNKGFAVSTLLYSLSIMGFLIVSVMVSIMSLNRINTKSLVKQVEDELNRYSLTETTFRADDSNTVTAQEFIVPQGEAGYYKIELWGAQGGTKSGKAGGRGAYTSGTIFLDENDKLYFYIGKEGQETNGGANGGATGDSSIAGGGGATDVRLIEDAGIAADNSSKYTRIMVAAGGGGSSSDRKGGDGGTLTGIKYYDQPQSAGAATQKINNTTSFLYSSSAKGAGGGYSAGGAQEGGSSYIAGYAGVNSFSREKDTSSGSAPTQEGDVIYKFYAKDDPEAANYTHIRDYYFYNGLMMQAVQDGDGYATIKKVSTATKEEFENNSKIPAIKTSYLNKIMAVKDCVTTIESKKFKADGTVEEKITSQEISWPEIQLINTKGENVLKDAPLREYNTMSETEAKKAIDGDLTTVAKTTNEAGMKCITIQVPEAKRANNIELAVYHQPGSLKNHKLTIYYNDGHKNIIGDDTATDAGDHEIYVTGDHISSYSPEYGNNNIPNGNYYIIPTQNRSRVLTTFAQSDTFGTGTDILDKTELKTSKITGSNYQKWYIESLGDGNYKIVEAQDSKALQISTGLYKNDEVVSAPYQFVGNPEEKWRFNFDKKGRTQIYSVNGSSKAYLRHIDGNKIVIDGGTGDPVRKDASGVYQEYRTYFYIINAEY